MTINVSWKTILGVLIGLGIVIILSYALIHSAIQNAVDAASKEAYRKGEEAKQKESQDKISEIQKSTQAQIDASNKLMESINSAIKAQEVLSRNIPNAKPYIIQLPAATQEQKPNQQPQTQLPEAPQPQVKKDNLLCYDEKGQIELAKFSEQCHQTAIALGGIQAQAAEKDKIITSKENEIISLKHEKTPGWWKRNWPVIKWASIAGAAVLVEERTRGR